MFIVITNMNTNKKAVVLSIGGLDSTTVLAMVRAQVFDIYSPSFSYGQHRDFELTAAQKIAAVMQAKQHLITHIDLKPIGGSALTDNIPVPKGRNHAQRSGLRRL